MPGCLRPGDSKWNKFDLTSFPAHAFISQAAIGQASCMHVLSRLSLHRVENFHLLNSPAPAQRWSHPSYSAVSHKVTIMASESLEDRFKKAVWIIRNGPKMESSNEQKLTFYSYFKQVGQRCLLDVTQGAQPVAPQAEHCEKI